MDREREDLTTLLRIKSIDYIALLIRRNIVIKLKWRQESLFICTFRVFLRACMTCL